MVQFYHGIHTVPTNTNSSSLIRLAIREAAPPPLTGDREMSPRSRLYYIIHTDTFGEAHQLGGAWEAESPDEAIALMLAESSTEDDGNWQTHVVLSESDIIG